MNVAASSSIRALAIALLAYGFASTASAAFGCAGVAGTVPASIIVATPEMRTIDSPATSCLPLNVQTFLERRRASEAQTASSTTLPAGANPEMMEGRFYMTQNGRRMTADDFDAWMRAKGIRVAKGAAATAAPPPPPPADSKQP